MTSTLGNSADEISNLVGEAEIEQAEFTAAYAAEAASKEAVAKSVAGRSAVRMRWVRRYWALLLGADTVAGLAAASGAYFARGLSDPRSIAPRYLGEHANFAKVAAISLVAWLMVQALSGAYRSRHVASDERDYWVPIRSVLRLIATFALASYVFHFALSRAMLLGYTLVLLAAVVIGRSVVNLALRHARTKGRARARVLLVGTRRTVREFADHLLSRPDDRGDIVAVCTTGPADSISVHGKTLPVIGSPDDVLKAVGEIEVDTVVFANPSGLESMSLQQVAWELEHNRVDLLVAPDTVALAGPRLRVSSLRGLPMLQVSHPQHEGVLRTVHFALSRVIAAALLAFAAPVFLAVAIAIKLSSSGPVFYRQRRIGYKGQEFDMLKFRSMIADAEDMLPQLLHLNEHDGALFKIKNDPRITEVGRVLRKYCLDELPQLINVVRGEMTLVGPRPCLTREITMFGQAEHRRFMVRPGMTGLWQVSGGPTLPWEDAIRMDLHYVDNWTPLLDLLILLRTARVILRGSGI